MDSKILFFFVASIAISTENDDMEHLIKYGKYSENNTNTDAFLIAFNKLTVPLKRQFNIKGKGIAYEYHDHLYSAILTVKTHIKLTDPIPWCMEHIHEYTKRKNYNPQLLCEEKMEKFGFKSTAEHALYLSFYRFENTNAKSPMEFCNFEILPALQSSVDQNAQFIEDVNAQSSEFTTTAYLDEYRSLSSYTPHVNISGTYTNSSLEFRNENESPAFPVEQNLQFGLSQTYNQPPARQNNHIFDLNMQPYEYISPPSVYLGEYSSINSNQTSTSTYYVDNNKCVGYDLNKSPPTEDGKEDE